jgi:putative ABC transport system substrate-binding protein
VKRREFNTLLGGAAAAWPLVARAQQPEQVRRIGVLMGMADGQEAQARVMALKQGPHEFGWTAGRNIQIETRFGGGDAGRIRAHATELVALAPDVIVGQSTPVIRALREATSSIPIVMAAINDPVDQGFVSSLARPGGNITGFTFVDFQLVGKWLEILKEAAPGVVRAALMFNPERLASKSRESLFDFGRVAKRGLPSPQLRLIEVWPRTNVGKRHNRETWGGGLIIPPDVFTIVHHQLFIRLAQQYRLPAIYAYRTYVAQGALISYGPDPHDSFRRSASYVDRIFKGAKPADLPVQQPTKLELAINLKAAKALGLDVPPTLLARADEVIE